MCHLVNESASFSFQALQIELTNRCNLTCSTCLHSVKDLHLITEDLSLSTLLSSIKPSHHIESVHLQGWGEVMLLDNLIDYIHWFKEQGCRVSATTNGTLMTPSRATELVTSGLDSITFSMAGAEKKTQDDLRGEGSHKKLWQAMEMMQKARVRSPENAPLLSVSYLLTPETFGQLPRAVQQSASRGVSFFVGVHLTHPVTEQQMAMQLWNNFSVKQLKKNVRHAHWQAFLGRIRLQLPSFRSSLTPVCDKNPLERCFIAADGSVSPCVFLYPPPVNFKKSSIRKNSTELLPVQCFGSLQSETLAEIWRRKEYREFRNIFARRKKVYDEEMAKVGVDLDGITQLELAQKRIQKAFAEHPVPDCCSSCPKMEGF